MQIAVNVEGTKRALAKLALDLEVACRVSIEEALDAAEKSALEAIRAQTHRRTGDLEDKLQPVMINNFRGKLFNLSDHAAYIDEGTRAHTITARKGGMLMFRMGTALLFRRSVQHPGAKARPFVAIAQASGQMALRDGLNDLVNKLAASF